MIAKLDKRLKDKDMGIELTHAAKNLLAEQGLRPGARCASAAPHHPARDRGRARPRRSSSASSAPARSSPSTSTGEGKEATFTFEGTPHAGPIDVPVVAAEG